MKFSMARGVTSRRLPTPRGVGIIIARVRPDGSGVSVEARFSRLSNLHGAPPNPGVEVFSVLPGYKLPR